MEKHILYNFSKEDHKKRLLNIKAAEKYAESFKKREHILDYEPGHYIYQGHEPDAPEKDEALFKKLSEGGVKYIYTWSVWAELENRWNGKRMFTPKDPERTRAFIELAHKYGLKVLPYTSTNFFNRGSKLFDPDWAYDEQYDLVLEKANPDGSDLRLAHCSPSSPGWREQLLYNYKYLLDNFDYDGVYIDSGYIRRCDYICFRNYYEKDPVMVKDEIPAFPEDANHDGGMADLIALIRSEVKRRGGTVTVFKEGTDRFRTDENIFDYMFAGECATDIDYVREMIRDYKHVMLDFSPDKKIAESEYYLNTVPFLHFPLLKTGSITVPDPNAIIPDIDYSINWLKLFRKMTREGTYFYMDVECPKLISGKDDDVVCSLYVNDDFYMVLANFSTSDKKLTLSKSFVEILPDQSEKSLSAEITLKSREIKILKAHN